MKDISNTKLLTIIIGIIMIIIFFYFIIPSSEEQINNAIKSYRIEEYSGVVVKKFIDKEEHNFKKVIINEYNQERIILFDQELSGIFNFINVGDSIIKKKGTLQVHLIRNNLDTIMNMKFVNLKSAPVEYNPTDN